MTAPAQAKAPAKFNDVINALNAGQPAYRSAYHHFAASTSNWSSNFTLTYEVTLNGWRYIVQAHVHIDFNGNAFAGNTYIPGFSGDSVQTPGWIVAAAPAYNAAVHVNGWCSDSAYNDNTLYKGAYRYPTKL